jgi:hypothetical protein
MMKAFSILVIALLATSALSNFVPIPDYNLSKLQGTWYVQSLYTNTANDYSLSYCLQFDFVILNSSVVNCTVGSFDGHDKVYHSQSVLLYPDSENPAILYQDIDHKNAPLLVLNSSSIPYWVDNTSATTIIAFNYTYDLSNPLYFVYGLSQWYDTTYDIRPFIAEQNLPPLNYSNNFWFVNSACDTHYNWNPLKSFNEANIQNKTYNLIVVYDPAGSDLVPWYTGSSIYDWEQAYCAKFSFTQGPGFTEVMTLSLKSFCQGGFERFWTIYPDPSTYAVLLGFNIDANTLLYVSYADILGNIILTAGTTTTFFLSTSATTLTPALKAAFEAELIAMSWTVDFSLIYPIDNSSC